MSASIFISYAGRDQAAATQLCAALEARGYPCWIASRDVAPGASFQVEIVRAIRAAPLVALVFTENANHSDEIAKELALASQARVPVIPLRMEAVSTPNEVFAYEFATRQWIDFTADQTGALDQLCRRIALSIEAPPAPGLSEPPSPVAAAPPATRRARGIGGWLAIGGLGVLALGVVAILAGLVIVLAPFLAPRHPMPAASNTAPPVAAHKPAPTSDVPY
jgi:hypothetical protein